MFGGTANTKFIDPEPLKGGVFVIRVALDLVNKDLQPLLVRNMGTPGLGDGLFSGRGP